MRECWHASIQAFPHAPIPTLGGIACLFENPYFGKKKATSQTILVMTAPTANIDVLDTKTWTVEEYHYMAEVGLLQADERVELLGGEIVKMSPIKSPHAGCVDFLNQWLVRYLGDRGIIRVQNPIALDERSEPEPDLTILKFDPNYYRVQHPTAEDVLCLIEVADTTLRKDREVKLKLYAESGIPEYWIVNLNDHSIEVYTEPRGGEYDHRRVYHRTDVLETPTVQGLKVQDVLG